MNSCVSIVTFGWAGLENGLTRLCEWLVGFAPVPLQSLLFCLIIAAVIMGGFAGLFAVITLLERKGLGRIQNRPGPNRAGPFGILQPAADGVKMLTKEDIIPLGADRILHFLAPIVMLAPVTLAFAVLPYAPTWVPARLDAGLIFFFAVGAAAELAAFMAGWSSRNKYSLLGAMRAIAQMISFEMPLVLATLAVVMITGTMNLSAIAEVQNRFYGILPQWHVFTPWGLVGFVLFMIAATAETNRSPFDLPEGESEIIGGFMTEYSGFKYAVFFMAEYFGMFAISGLASTLFLGGYAAPVSFLPASVIWFIAKLVCLVFGFIWLRGTLPRLRVDQLMNFAWKFLLPMSLVNILVAMLWHYTAGWCFAGAWPSRWIICFGIIAIPFWCLGRTMMVRRGLGPRTYRFAT